MDRISTSIIQKCQQGDKEFSKVWFIKLLTDNTNQFQFDRFCREVLLLNERYDTTCGCFATDKPMLSSLYPDLMWELEEIDFDQPINFKKIK